MRDDNDAVRDLCAAMPPSGSVIRGELEMPVERIDLREACRALSSPVGPPANAVVVPDGDGAAVVSTEDGRVLGRVEPGTYAVTPAPRPRPAWSLRRVSMLAAGSLAAAWSGGMRPTPPPPVFRSGHAKWAGGRLAPRRMPRSGRRYPGAWAGDGVPSVMGTCGVTRQMRRAAARAEAKAERGTR